MSKGLSLTLLVLFTATAVLFAVSLTGPGGFDYSVLAEPVIAASDSRPAGGLEYVGSEKCRICHLEIYKSWKSTRHAGAMSLLAPNHTTDSACVRCHITGVGRTGYASESVGCEACHGPGSEYRKMRIMKDLELAVQHGLVIQSEAVCRRCHNEDSPTFKGFDHTSIDIEEIHLMPSGID